MKPDPTFSTGLNAGPCHKAASTRIPFKYFLRLFSMNRNSIQEHVGSLRPRFKMMIGAMLINLSLASLHLCFAQSSRDLSQASADYPVGEPAALHAVQEYVPAMLEPASVRTLAFSASLLQSDNQHSALGIELAPFLMGNDIDLSKYRSGRLFRLLVRTRVSFAMNAGHTDEFRGAFGLRWSLHDDADLAADPRFRQGLVDLGTSNPDLQSECAAVVSADSEAYRSCLTHRVSQQPALQPQIDKLRDDMKEMLWNHSNFELSVAQTFHSSPSATPVHVEQWHSYFSFVWPLIGSSGQVGFGANGSLGYPDSSATYERRGAITVRGYYGTANARAFLEFRLAARTNVLPDLLPALGAALRVANGVWLQASISASLLERSWTGTQAQIRLSVASPEIHS
jgi:hypothetical protein